MKDSNDVSKKIAWAAVAGAAVAYGVWMALDEKARKKHMEFVEEKAGEVKDKVEEMGGVEKVKELIDTLIER